MNVRLSLLMAAVWSVLVYLVASASDSPPSCFNLEASGEDAVTRHDIVEKVLSQDFQGLDSTLASTLLELRARGAHRCWHKHSTFLDHLLAVHHILRLWGQGPIIGRVGLLHRYVIDKCGLRKQTVCIITSRFSQCIFEFLR